MSLYVYVVPVTDKQADAWEKYVEHRQSLSIFSSHRCWESNCYVEGIDIYKDSISFGRPALSEGACEAESWYGRQVVGENEFVAEMLRISKTYGCATDCEAPDSLEKVEAWFKNHNGQTVIICNDNEV